MKIRRRIHQRPLRAQGTSHWSARPHCGGRAGASAPGGVAATVPWQMSKPVVYLALENVTRLVGDGVSFYHMTALV